MRWTFKVLIVVEEEDRLMVVFVPGLDTVGAKARRRRWNQQRMGGRSTLQNKYNAAERTTFIAQASMALVPG